MEHYAAALSDYEVVLETVVDVDAPELKRGIWRDIENCLEEEPGLSQTIKKPLERLRYRLTAANQPSDDEEMYLYFE
jgi:hypothetical protein